MAFAAAAASARSLGLASCVGLAPARLEPAAVACLALATPVVAHGGSARLELGSEAAPAGSTLEVRVVELWLNEPVEIVLVGPGGRERSLGSGTGTRSAASGRSSRCLRTQRRASTL